MGTTTHVMKPRPPVAAFGVAAVFALVGIALFIAPDLFSWDPILRMIGLVFLAIGLLLLAISIGVARRPGAAVVLDERGFRVVGPQGARAGTWDDIIRVSRATGRIILYRRDGGRVSLVVPKGGSADLNALGADIAARLDANRGYGPLNAPASQDVTPVEDDGWGTTDR